MWTGPRKSNGSSRLCNRILVITFTMMMFCLPGWKFPRQLVCLCVCACVLSCSVMSTLCSPTDYNLPGSSVHRISQARILEWVAISSPQESALLAFQACCIGLNLEAPLLTLLCGFSFLPHKFPFVCDHHPPTPALGGMGDLSF